MDITIGIKQIPRELVITSPQDTEEVTAAVRLALSGKGPLELLDERGVRILVPADAIGFVEIGTELPRRVGFGAM